MVFYCKITVGGTTFTNIERVSVRKRKNNKAGTFSFTIPNDSGVNKTSFSVGNEVIIYCDSNNPSTTKIFCGVVEEIEFESPSNNREFITLSGRDYSSKLQDTTALESYSNQESSVIIKNLIDKYVTGLTYNNVDTGDTPSRIQFKHKNIFDCIKEIADINAYDFWVDDDKDLHFEQESTTSSGVVADEYNLVGTAQFTEDRDELFNEVYVYGGRYLSGWQESFTSAGSVGTGSVFTLEYKPHNTYVTVGGTKKKGSIFELTSNPQSGIQYLVNYDDKKLIFISGTTWGDNVPGSLAVVVAQYDRSLPIIKFVRDVASISQYGKRTKVITNNELSDPNQVLSTASSYLSAHKLPKKQGKLKLKGVNNLILGTTLEVNLPNQNIVGQTFAIQEVNYDITPSSLLSEQIITVTVAEKIRDVIDVLGDVIKDIKKIQARDIDTTEVLSRLESSTGSLTVGVNYWKVSTVNDLGSSFILDWNGWHGQLGSHTNQNYLGDSRGAKVLQQSGGLWL